MSERAARVGVIVGGVLVAAGAFMPWASVGIFAVSGIQGDGIFALILGVSLAFVGFLILDRGPEWGERALILILSTLAFGLYAVEWHNISERASPGSIISLSVGAGIYVGAIGALWALLVSNAIGKRAEPPAPP